MSVSQSQLRPLLIIKAMKGRSFTGISNKELADTLNEDPSQITRALATLIHAGFVEQLDNNLYALSTEILAIAQRHTREVTGINSKIQEISQKAGE